MPIEIKVLLDSAFSKKLAEVMSDELLVSSKKWGVALDEEALSEILRHSFNQLNRKVRESLKSGSDLDSDDFLICVIPYEKNIVFLEGEENEGFTRDDNVRIKRVRYSFLVNDEDSDEGVLVKDFPEAVRKHILEWAKTAVFYGVGSYA